MKITDSQKNIRAGTITGIICGLMLLLFFIVSWTIPLPEIPPEETGIEVNLGNSDEGLGTEAPMIPGQAAAETVEVNTPPKTHVTQPEVVKQVETNDNDKEAPDLTIPKPVVPKPNSPSIPKKENTVPVKTHNPAPEVVDNPKPVEKKPAAVYKGGDGSSKGGNNADTWNSSKNQGIAGGKGDQGKAGGNPESDSYKGSGGSGKSGVSISRGLQGRRISTLPSFEDEFNDNAKIAVDVKVDGKGNVISATYQPRGSTTSDAGMREIALRKARQIHFNSSANGDEESIGTLIFNFRLKN
jgi:outer membrane biosynthesis protein TonB